MRHGCFYGELGAWNIMSYWQNDENNWRWGSEFEPFQVLNYIEEFFDYDHQIGRLRWTRDRASWERLPSSMKRKVQQGNIAGSNPAGRDYQIKIGGSIRTALKLVWEHQTGNCIHRIMTIRPNETRFSIDNLCVIPKGNQRAPKHRAKGCIVVSWSYERKQFTVVQVDKDYNKTILSYHSDIDSAFNALNNPVVSFL